MRRNKYVFSMIDILRRNEFSVWPTWQEVWDSARAMMKMMIRDAILRTTDDRRRRDATSHCGIFGNVDNSHSAGGSDAVLRRFGRSP